MLSAGESNPEPKLLSRKNSSLKLALLTGTEPAASESDKKMVTDHLLSNGYSRALQLLRGVA